MTRASWVAALAAGLLAGFVTGCQSEQKEAGGTQTLRVPTEGRPMALEFSGVEYAQARSVPLDRCQQFTIEAWVKDWRGPILCQGMSGDPENSIWISTGTRANVGAPHESCGWEARRGENYEAAVGYGVPGKWNHVAMVFDGTRQTLFLNGMMVSQRAAPWAGPLDTTRPLLIGAHMYGETPAQWTYAQGVLGPVRISNVARYSGVFLPSMDWKADDTTLALWIPAEGDAMTLPDRSNYQRDATVFGAKLVER